MRATESRRATKLLGPLGLLAATMTIAAPTRAADWPIIQGTEEGQPEGAVRPFGFVQVTGEGAFGGRVSGLRGKALVPFNGQRPTFNAINDDASWGLAVRRARPGLRGAIPGTNRRVTYFVLAELGTAAIAREGPTLTDAAVTLSYIPGARLRAGQFKLPMMDETVEANPIAAEWINFSLPASALVLENEVQKGRYVGGASGFRDVGVEAFDTFRWAKLALSYAVMVSNGNRRLEGDDAKDVTARTAVSWVFSGAASDPHRQEVSVFAWGQRGERTIDGVGTQRIRSGVGAHLEKGRIRVRAEAVYASGALVLGQSPPFPGQPIAVADDGRALGFYAQTRVRVLGRFLVGVRYEELRRQLDDRAALRIFRGLTPMIEYDIVPRARLQLTYERRWFSAPHGAADALTIARAAGDRAAAQLTVVF